MNKILIMRISIFLKLFLFFSLFSIIDFQVFGQVPESMNYQAVIRDGSGNIVASQSVGIRIDILQGSATGTSVYQETFTPTTNAYGSIAIQIGTGTVVNGNFSTINWGANSYFVETAVDLSGGNNYTVISTTQFVSVPYALYAKAAGTSGSSLWTQDATNSSLSNISTTGIRGTSDTTASLTVNATDTAYAPAVIRLKGKNSNGEDFQWVDLKSYVDDQISGSSSRFSILTRSDGVMKTNFTVGAEGYVGIGTTSPTSILQLSDENNSGPTLRIDGLSPSILLQDNSGVSNTLDNFEIRNILGSLNFSYGDYSDVYDDGFLSNTALTISGSGNVGIGIGNPNSKLDISNGYISLSGIGSKSGIVSNINLGTFKLYCGPYTGNSSNGFWFRASDSLGQVDSFTNLFKIEPHDIDVVRVGVGTMSPQRNLHINDVMRLEPRPTAPTNPSKGDIYMDDSDNTLKFYDGASWENATGSPSSSNSNFPAGMIMPFAGTSIPAGWLLCDGSSVLKTTYSDLYSALGDAWGSSSSTTFNIPDLRGRFLRGVDSGSGNDPDASSRTAINSGGNTGDNVGSYQDDEFKTHNHAYDKKMSGNQWLQTGYASDSNVGFGNESTSNTGGLETRPKNAYVNYIIKY